MFPTSDVSSFNVADPVESLQDLWVLLMLNAYLSLVSGIFQVIVFSIRLMPV